MYLNLDPRKRKKYSTIVGGSIVIVATLSSMPWWSAGAQDARPPAPVMIMGPVSVRGANGSGGDRAVLQVTNVSDRPIRARLGIRDAGDFFGEPLATETVMLQPGEGASLPFNEPPVVPVVEVGQNQQAIVLKSLVGVVSPLGVGGPQWGEDWQARSSVIASLTVADITTGEPLVVAPGIIAILVGL